MNRILIAAIAAISFAGVASAQSPASDFGSTRVGSSQNETQAPASAGIDTTTTGSITPDQTSGGYDASVMKDDLHR